MGEVKKKQTRRKSATSTSNSSPNFEAAMTRAEGYVDIAAEKIDHYSRNLAQQLRYYSSRAREEGEDVWVEAQNLRKEMSQTQA